jgi:hypothetical protein
MEFCDMTNCDSERLGRCWLSGHDYRAKCEYYLYLKCRKAKLEFEKRWCESRCQFPVADCGRYRQVVCMLSEK